MVKLPNCISICITFFLVSFTWLFFRAESLVLAFDMLKHLFFNPFDNIRSFIYVPGFDTKLEFLLLFFIPFMILFYKEFICEFGKGMKLFLSGQLKIIRWIEYITIMMFILLIGVYGGENNHNAFIYFQF